ncbi:MAG: InlB B-repeat-containing protein [Chloroflexota bacterium]
MSADCSEAFAAGTVVTLTAGADTGSTFTGWSGACTNSTGDCVHHDRSPSGNHLRFANLHPDVEHRWHGSGSITANPDLPTMNMDGGDVNGRCRYRLNIHRLVGTYNSTGDCVLTMTEAQAVTATFDLQTFILTLNTDGTGSGSITANPDLPSYEYGTVVTLTAVADTGSTFTGWSGACTNSTGDCVLTMTEAQAVTATFDLQTFILTLNTDGTGSGSITANPDLPSYEYGTVVTLTAVADTGSTFTGWSGACTNSTGDCVLIITEAASVTATFTKEGYTIYLPVINRP